jgi:deoxyadenosine/deoxycytidine kinase
MSYKISDNIQKGKKIIISIEGNIGSGKSTFLKLMRKYFKDNVKYVDEPVTDWLKVQTDDGQNLIENFYADKERYGYIFQNFAYITRIRRLYDAILNSKEDIIITERSVESDRHLFAEMLEEDGYINQMEKGCYDYWYNFLNIEIDYFVYIKTTPDNCMKRIGERSRRGEDMIEREYIDKLDEKHDKWLLGKKNMIILDGNLNFRDDKGVFNRYLEEIKSKCIL